MHGIPDNSQIRQLSTWQRAQRMVGPFANHGAVRPAEPSVSPSGRPILRTVNTGRIGAGIARAMRDVKTPVTIGATTFSSRLHWSRHYFPGAHND